MEEKLVQELIGLSKEKANYLTNILDLTKEQKRIIKEENMERLNQIIEKKSEIIKEIDKLDVSFIMKLSQLKKENNIGDLNEIDTKKYPNLKELKEVVAQITSILMAISIVDKENNKALEEGLEKVKLNLKKVKEGKKAYKGYNKSIPQSMLIDEKK